MNTEPEFNEEHSSPERAHPSTEPPSEPGAPRRSWDLWHAVLGAAVVALGITSLWLWYDASAQRRQSLAAVAGAEQRGAQELSQQAQRSQQEILATREEAAQLQASAFATAIQPIMTFKGQVPEITDRSIQAATENLARQGSYSLVTVTDANGAILASSDLTTIGRPYPGELREGVSKVQGENQAVASIGSEGSRVGWVVIRVRSSA